MNIHDIFSDVDNVNDIEKHDKKKFKKECKDYVYVPIIFPKQRRIIVIGDLHGSLDHAISALKIALVIDDDKNWIGGDTFVIQCGDQIDSCRPDMYKCDDPRATKNDKADDIKILHFYTNLNKKAMVSGGRVISLLGNHEIMNVLGNVNYVSYENLKALSAAMHEGGSVTSGIKKRKELFKLGNKYGKFLACTRVSVVVIGSFMFVHGGMVPDFTKKLNIKNRQDLYRLNYIIRRWLLGLMNNNKLAKLLNNARESMFWNRLLGELPKDLDKDDPRCVQYLDPILRIFKIKKMIIAHTPQYFYHKTGMNSTCDSKIWRVDVGYSHAFDGFDEKYNNTGVITDLRKVQVLEIKNDSVIKVLK